MASLKFFLGSDSDEDDDETDSDSETEVNCCRVNCIPLIFNLYFYFNFVLIFKL